MNSAMCFLPNCREPVDPVGGRGLACKGHMAEYTLRAELEKTCPCGAEAYRIGICAAHYSGIASNYRSFSEARMWCWSTHRVSAFEVLPLCGVACQFVWPDAHKICCLTHGCAVVGEEVSDGSHR